MKEFKKVAKEFNINPEALKRRIKQHKGDKNNRNDCIIIVFTYADSLMYSREEEFKDGVDYLDMQAPWKVTQALKTVDYLKATIDISTLG